MAQAISNKVETKFEVIVYCSLINLSYRERQLTAVRTLSLILKSPPAKSDNFIKMRENTEKWKKMPFSLFLSNITIKCVLRLQNTEHNFCT